MSRLSLPIWLIVIVFVGVCMFHVKFAVQELEAQLSLTERQITQSEEALRVLRAEWSYLNEPSRLADLNQRHLGLVPVAAGQMVGLDALPVRIDPPADPETLPPIEEIPDMDAPIASAPPPPIPVTPVSVAPAAIPAAVAPAKPAAPQPVAAVKPVTAVPLANAPVAAAPAPAPTPTPPVSSGPSAEDAAALTDLFSTVEETP
ncbi:MAG: energy transducer TonB [Dongiaceae bacterium]